MKIVLHINDFLKSAFIFQCIYCIYFFFKKNVKKEFFSPYILFLFSAQIGIFLLHTFVSCWVNYDLLKTSSLWTSWTLAQWKNSTCKTFHTNPVKILFLGYHASVTCTVFIASHRISWDWFMIVSQKWNFDGICTKGLHPLCSSWTWFFGSLL